MIAMEDEDCFNYIRKIPSTNYQYVIIFIYLIIEINGWNIQSLPWNL